MSTRRTLEVWNGPRSIVFRSKLSGTEGDAVMIVRCQEIDFVLSGDEVEAVHQFTYDLLAGPHRDPRLDVPDGQIMCGAREYSPANGHLECALFDGHSPIGAFAHITSTGLVFDGAPGF